jgi:Yip1 domain
MLSDGDVMESQAGPGLSQVERVVDTFIAPTKTFADMLRSTSWWLPFLLAVLVSLCVTFAIDKQVGFDRVVENVIHDSPRQEEALANATPEQRAAQIKKTAAGYRYVSYAFPLFILLVTAIAALGLWASFNFGLGARTTYGQMFAVWMYASLPKLVTGVLTLAIIYLGGNAEGFDLKNPVGTNPAYYLPDAAPWLKSALGYFDLIGLWTLVLLVIGTSIVAKVSRGRAAALVIGWWVLLLVISAVSAAAFS